MNMRDLIPWARGSHQPMDFYRDDRSNPLVTLQREMNRMLDEAFRGFDMPAFLGARQSLTASGWPRLEVAETDKDICILAEVPGLEENDVELTLSDGNLIIRGEKKSEVEDKDRQFTERFYGRFERHIPVGVDIEDDKIEASFKNGVLKISLPKTERARAKSKRIAINAPTKH